MVLGVVGSNGQKCPIVFIGAGECVNADIYQDLLRQHVVSMIQQTFFYNVFRATRYKTTSLPAALNRARRIDTLFEIVLL
jgi:hypothetical protein